MKADGTPVKWACVTLHEWLPSKSVQIAGARAWGAHPDWYDGIDISNTFIDDVRGVRTTNWPSKLEQREILFKGMKLGGPGENLVYFRTPLCIGFSEKHLRSTLDALFKYEALAFVQTFDTLFKSDDDLAELVEEMAREKKSAEMRQYRKRKSK